jgi:hypothetical protein
VEVSRYPLTPSERRELLRELGEKYRLSHERAAYVAAQVEAQGYCPFMRDGRQYMATAYLHGKPGYEIRDETNDEEGAEQ